ncbi:MAG: hypothetical protein RLZ98_2367 [Pseudomonadota bacterium]|jgi:prepilin signal peptidase PulO-like enzyme (type II secretory pathway)
MAQLQQADIEKSVTIAAPRWALLIAFGSLYAALAAASLFDLPSPDPIWLVKAVVLGGLLVVLSVEDVLNFRLPDWMTGMLLLAGLSAAALAGIDALLASAVSACAGFALLWLAGEAYRRVRNRDGLGFGDVKLLGAVGAWVGVWALPTVILAATMTALAASLAAVLRGRRLDGMSALPFGPFLALGTWIVWLYGHL